MSNAAALQALEYEAETTFGEDVTTFATHRIPIVAGVSMSGIKHDKIDSERSVQYLQDGTRHILGPQEGQFTIKLWAHGHGATTAGTPSVDAIETFMSYVFGNPASNADLSLATSQTFTGTGTASAPATSGASGIAAGGLIVTGVLGDGRGNGQFQAVSTQAASVANMLTALDATPSNGDVIYPVVQFHLPEDATGSATIVTGLRFRWRTANLGVELHGCFPMSVKLTGTNPGEIPQWEITFGVSWWRYTATSGVSSVTSNQYNPAPTCAGSLFFNTVGTATRAKRTCRSLSIDITLGVQPLEGPGGANAYQKIIGAKRTQTKISLKWTEDADAATATPTLDGFFTAASNYHALFTLSTTAGSRVGVYFRNLCITGARPIQVANDNINRLEIEATAYTGTTLTSELTRAAMVVGYA